MKDIEYRLLNNDEAEEARQLSNRNPDIFYAHSIEHLPCYCEIAERLQPTSLFLAKQCLMLGAFSSSSIVGTVFVESIDRMADIETSAEHWEKVRKSYPERDVNEFCALTSNLAKALFGSPNGSLSIHTLCVAREFRQRGIARALLTEVINRLGNEELSNVYIEVARIPSHMRLCESLGFRSVRKRLSLTSRLRYGCWGSALYKFAS